jgi:c-di-GMP-binding flagellar brake protein YcgR
MFRPQNKTGSDIPKADSGGYRISASAQIVSILKNLMKGRAMISVNLPHEEQQYPSAILKIDDSINAFYLDELNDAAAHQRFSAAKRIEVEARLDGVLVRFSSELQKAGKSKDGIGFYRAALPLFLFYFQRRDTHRIKITRQQPYLTGKLRSNHQPIDGHLHDISIGGIGLISETKLILQRGDLIVQNRFLLPGGEEMHCDLEIRFLQEMKQQSILRIGCQFTQLTSSEQQLITQEIARLEREQLRVR